MDSPFGPDLPNDHQQNTSTPASEAQPGYAPEALFRALQASEERWRSLIENSHDWIWEVDATGCYTYASPRVRELLGYSPEEVLGKTPFDFMPPGERQRVLELFTAALTLRLPFQGLENINQRKDGSLVVLETNATPFFDEKGRFAGYRGIDRDITARKHNEMALRRKSEEMEAMFSTTHIHIAVLDRDLKVVRVNRSFASQLRRDNASLLGHSIFELYPNEELKEIFRQVVISGTPYSAIAHAYEFGTRAAQGVSYWDWTLSPIKDESGDVEGLVLTLVDATEREHQRRAAEAAHRHAHAQLEMRVRERTAALLDANRELEAFSYAICHDLRAPLRAIDGFTLALGEDCDALLDEQGRCYLERIHLATKRMGVFIDGLLDLSLTSRNDLHRQQVDLTALAHNVIQHLREQEPLRHVDAQIEPGLSAFGDPALMQLLLQNLFGNAWKFTARRADAAIQFRQEILHGQEVFVVRDNGVGFAQEQATRLFQPFTRLHARNEFEGHGIGLATVRRIVERHGGAIGADGAPEQGAAFYFTLAPLANTSATAHGYR